MTLKVSRYKYRTKVPFILAILSCTMTLKETSKWGTRKSMNSRSRIKDSKCSIRKRMRWIRKPKKNIGMPIWTNRLLRKRSMKSASMRHRLSRK